MGQIVRRVAQPSEIVTTANNASETHIHKVSGFAIASRVIREVQPKVEIAWDIHPQYWQQGFRLLAFHDTHGFCDERWPDNLNDHGQLIIDTRENGVFEDYSAEGKHFFTFVLRKEGSFFKSERRLTLRFSENVPSAKLGIQRIKEQIELTQLLQQHQIDQIDFETKLAEAEYRLVEAQQKLEDIRNPQSRERPRKKRRGDPVLADQLADIDTMVDAIVAREKKIESLKRNKQFQSLIPADQERIINRIKRRINAGEMNARREIDES